MTENVLVPVTSFITESREKCDEVREWVEEQVTRPVERWVSQQERRCRELPWWNPLRWFCEIVIIVVKVVEWVVVTVGKWVVTIVCQIVTWVVGIVVTFVLRVVGWFVTFVVCIFSEPLVALASFRDLWTIIVDTVGEIFGFVDVLLDDVLGILDDVGRLLDSLADSLGWLGLLLGIVKGLLNLVRELVSIIKDAVGAVKDIVLGILGLNLCRILRGLTDLGTGLLRAILATWLVYGFPVRVVGAAVGGVRDGVNRIQLQGVITDAVNGAFGAGSDRANRSLDTIGVGSAPMGLPCTVDARRLFLSSDAAVPSVQTLHTSGVIDLYALAGYASTCGEVINQPEGEVVYAGSNLTVSYADLSVYLAEGPGSVPEFHVFPITRAKLRQHLEVARRKAYGLGIHLLFPTLGVHQATSASYVPFASTTGTPDGTVQRQLIGELGTPDGLENIPLVSHFHYVIGSTGRELFGLATGGTGTTPAPISTRPTVGARAGVTYRNRTPDWAFRWVAVHEMGHYLGQPGSHLNRHGNERGLGEIMYTPLSGVSLGGWTIPEYALFSGEPRFTLDDARTTWEFVIANAADLLP